MRWPGIESYVGATELGGLVGVPYDLAQPYNMLTIGVCMCEVLHYNF
jgi:hypothetical protein